MSNVGENYASLDAGTQASDHTSMGAPSLGTQSMNIDDSSKGSSVWPHFTILPEYPPSDRHASCNHCSRKIKCVSSHGTTCLRNHLKRCEMNPENANRKTRKKMSKSPKTPIFDQEMLKKALVRMILKCDLPFRFVEKEGFIEFCLVWQPQFVMPSRTTIARHCYSVFLEERKVLKDAFAKLSSSICLTSDTWTSIQNSNYMCVTAHFIDSDWTLHKKIINFCVIPSHSGKVLGFALDKCLSEWDLKNVLSVTLDNASSNDVSIQTLKRLLSIRNGAVLNGEYLHMRCAAHILNLIVKDGLQDYNVHISRVRAAVKYVRSSPSRYHRFKECVALVKIASKSIPCLDVETRWNSTYLMLASAVTFKTAFEMVFETMNKNQLKELDMPKEEDWNYVANFLPFLKIFYDTTISLSGSFYVTGESYLRHIMGLKAFIVRMSTNSNPSISSVAKNMKSKYEKYFSNVNNMNLLMFIVVVLDPRYKLADLHILIEKSYDVVRATDLKEKVNAALYAMFEAYSPMVQRREIMVGTSEPRVSNIECNMDAAAYMDSFFDDEIDDLTVSNKTELEIYLLEVKCDKRDPGFNILAWWKANCVRYPTLARMARDVLAIPVSTVASESAFSTGGRILDSFRSSLSPRMVEAIICTRDWLQTNKKIVNFEESLEELESIEAGNVISFLQFFLEFMNVVNNSVLL